jgi:hypothetical protein
LTLGYESLNQAVSRSLYQKQTMNKLFPLLLTLAVTACAALPMPADPIPMPSAQQQTQVEQALASEHINALDDMVTALLTWSVFIEEENPGAPAVGNLVVTYANSLDLETAADQFQEILTIDARNELLDKIFAQIGHQYGALSQIFSEITFQRGMVGYYITQAAKTEDNTARNSYLTKSRSAIALAIDSLDRIAPDSPLRPYGSRLYLLAPNYRDLEAGQDEIDNWFSTVLYSLLAREDLPSIALVPPSPTPIPRPTLTPQPIALDNYLDPVEIYQKQCAVCHTFDNSRVAIAPSFTNIHEVAATRLADQSARDYLYTSIVDPNAYVVPGYVAGIMQQHYGELLPAESIHALVDWLLDPERPMEEQN